MAGVTVPAGFGVHNGKQGLDSVCLRRGQADLHLQFQEMGGAGKAVKLRRFGEAPAATGRQVSDVFLREGLDGAALFAAIRCRVACCQGHIPVTTTSRSVDIKRKDRCMLSSSSMGRGEINRGISSIRSFD